MSRPAKDRAALIIGLILALCLSAAVLRRYRASAAAGEGRSTAEASTTSASLLPAANLAAPVGPAAAAVPQTSPTPSPSPSPSPTPVVQALKFWMYGAYLYPMTIYAQPGPTLIVVSNQTQANVSLNLLPYGASASSAAVVSTQNQTNSSAGGAPPIQATGVVNLSAGQYIYYDQNNPAIQGVIVVQTNQ